MKTKKKRLFYRLKKFEVQSPGSGFWPKPDPHPWLKAI